MSAMSFEACRKLFAKAQNRFANCFIRHIVPVCSAAFSSNTFYGFGFSSWNFSNTWLPTRGSRVVQVSAVWRPGVPVNEVCTVLAKPLVFFSCKICSWKLCFHQFSIHQVNTAWSNLFMQRCVINKWATVGAKIFTHFSDIALFVLGQFILPHPVLTQHKWQWHTLK